MTNELAIVTNGGGKIQEVTYRLRCQREPAPTDCLENVIRSGGVKLVSTRRSSC